VLNTLFDYWNICSESSIAQAKELAAKHQLSNVHFYTLDAAHLDESWTDKFDWVTAVDAIHDQVDK
jgi:tRNA/tmRNA/rRNA uracil-C5-methylase (TrmA/RlmC/RlmD family)